VIFDKRKQEPQLGTENLFSLSPSLLSAPRAVYRHQDVHFGSQSRLGIGILGDRHFGGPAFWAADSLGE